MTYKYMIKLLNPKEVIYISLGRDESIEEYMEHYYPKRDYEVVDKTAQHI